MDKVIKTYEAETKAAKDRVLTVRISTSNPDRSKDVVVPKGAKLDNFQRNPVVLLGHNYSGLAVAKADDIQVTDDAIFARVKFPKKGSYDVADTVYELYKEGIMNAWSIGFMPIEFEERKDGGFEFKEWELFEFSAVAVPDNPEALTVARSKGIDTKPLEEVVEDKADEGETTKDVQDEEMEEPKDKSDQEGTDEVVNFVELSIEEYELLKEQAKQLEELIAEEVEEKEEPAEETSDELDLVEALRVADKVIGVALRNWRQNKEADLGN